MKIPNFKIGDKVRATKYIDNAYCSLPPYGIATITNVFITSTGAQIVDIEFADRHGEKRRIIDIVCLPENTPFELCDDSTRRNPLE